MSSLTPHQPDRAQVRCDLDQFKHRWRTRLDGWKTTGEGALEKKYAQSFWSDFLACFGINAARIDLFEQDARRGSSGNSGYIDLFWPSVVIGEAKSPGIDLQIAVDQARDYLQGGSVTSTEQPRYILASDFETFRLMRLGDPEHRYDITFTLAEVTDHLDQLRFLAGYEGISHAEEKAASLQASQLMAELFTAMVGDDVDENIGEDAPTNPEDEDVAVQETSMYLTRLLFLLFGDDAGLWEQDLFYRFVSEHTNSENLGSQLAALFNVLNTPEHRRKRVPDALAKFPYVNGSIFAETMDMQYFSPDMRDALLNACRFHWTDISPAIFGSLFQLVKSKEARRSDGEHYTSENNIMKTLGPLFLDELRDEANRLIQAKSTPVKKLRDFRDSLADHALIDPACGSGNFLLVAYRELRRIETDVIVAIREREGNTDMALDISWEQKLSIGQFYGIELNWWPAKIAETAMFLVDHQANRELADRVGLAPDRLPITITAHITHGNALAVEWAEVVPRPRGNTYVFGNPPFIGARMMSTQQKAELNAAWGGRKGANQLDYVTGWHAKALTLLADRPGFFAFVTTNSIVQGDQTARLFGAIFDQWWRIRFAHRTFQWDSEAPGKAAVHCVIVGFDRHHEPRPRLWDYPAVAGDPTEEHVERAINAYLVDGPNVLVEARRTMLSPTLAPASFGSMPNDGGHLIVEVDEYDHVTTDPIAVKYLRPFRMGKELVRGLERWCLWMADEFNPADVAQSVILRSRVEKVRTHRLSSKRDATRKRAEVPYLFGEIHQPKEDYIAIPRVVSQARRFYTVDHLSPRVIAGDKVYTAIDPDGLMFGLISSSMFITWQRTVGGRLKSDLNFANTLTWNTFPVPELDDETRQRIIDAGKKVLAARALHPEFSLAEHYNPLAMAPELIKAHGALDREVDKAMGAPRKLTTERQRQEVLFANYSRLTAPSRKA